MQVFENLYCYHLYINYMPCMHNITLLVMWICVNRDSFDNILM